MTAINLIVQPTLAYFVTDRAQYDADGVIYQIGSKVVLADALRAAVAYSGRASPDRIRAALQVRSPRSQDQLLAAVVQIASALQAENISDGQAGEADENDVQLFVAMWSTERQRPEGYFVSTNRAYFGESYRPNTLGQVNSLIVPEVDLGPIDVSDPDQFPLEVLGINLLEAQRMMPWVDDGVPGYFIGGGVDLTIVGRGGARQINMLDWPDKIGTKITPHVATLEMSDG